MNIDDSILDDERLIQFLNTLKKSRILNLQTYITMGFFGCIVYLIGGNLKLILGLTLIYFLIDLFRINDFNFVYHHDFKDEILTLYLLNLRGKKAIATFGKTDITKFRLSKNQKTITIPHIGNKQLNYLEKSNFEDVLEIAEKIKKTV